MSKTRQPKDFRLLIAGLLLCLGPAQTGAAEEEKPGWLESLLYNSAERSEEGATALKAAAPEAATEALDTALRLDPSSERARYNAGTAHLLAATEKAAPLLEAAAGSSDKELSARAFYNLGNSRFKGEDLKGAVEAYKESLRRDPSSADSKFNLELALRRLQEQQKQDQQDQQKQDQQKDQQKEEQQKKEGGQGQDDQQKQEEQQKQEKQQGQDPQKDQGEQQKQQEQQGQDGQEKEGKEGEKPEPQPGSQGDSSPLPQFHDLPDMDAQQAAAILEAIENLERNQRRQDAKKALKANASGKKDW